MLYCYWGNFVVIVEINKIDFFLFFKIFIDVVDYIVIGIVI